MEELRLSQHRLVVITGDNQYTAAHVASELKIVQEPVLFLRRGDHRVELVDFDNKVVMATNRPEELPTFARTHGLCVRGDFLDSMADLSDEQRADVIISCSVFARVSPSQKDEILGTYNRRHEVTLMCGDGTNDVGSLKRAHIGIALINKPETKAEQKNVERSYRRMMQEEFVSEGDACIAAPFTYKFESIKCVSYILRQGRCTLVTTLQMYKILAINGLMLAYSLSVLYQLGLKSGDFQSAVFGIPIAIYFFLISRARPLEKLRPYRPPTSIFALSQISSVLLQFAIHLLGIVLLTNISLQYTDPRDLTKPDGEFKPSVMNTILFLYLTFVDATNFLINYQGEPFMESIWKNRALMSMLLCHMGIVLIAAFDLSEDLRWFLQLHALPAEFPNVYLIGAMLLDFGLCYTVRSLIHWFQYHQL